MLKSFLVSAFFVGTGLMLGGLPQVAHAKIPILHTITKCTTQRNNGPQLCTIYFVATDGTLNEMGYYYIYPDGSRSAIFGL